ncbi:MAG TPA: hypothetical protein VLB47_00275 [Solirubrobacteraceae bacterium]|nr:hypothetical protein [Solirubrobacteraceae bacterium]
MERDWEERRREEMRPVEEAGGGEAEGFEQAEEDLVDRAENFDEGRSPLRDAWTEAETSDPGVYGEADEEESSEDKEGW